MTASTELATTLSGAVLLPITVGSLAYSAATLVARPLRDAPQIVRLTAAGLVSLWLVVVLGLVLLFCQCLHAAVFAGVSLLLAGVCRRWAAPVPVAAVRPRRRGMPLLLAAVLGALLLVQVGRALVLPPLAWDSLTYHLTIPAMWVQHGGYCQWAAPDAFGDYSRFPANGELFGAFLLLPFHGDLLVNLFGLPFLLLGAAALHGLASELGASRRAAALAAAVWMVSPPAFAYVTTQYVELPMAAEVFAGWLFALRFGRTRAPVDAVLAGAAFGLAVGTKHLALVPAAIGVLWGLWLLVRHRARVVPGLGGGLLAAAVVGAPWYLRNWIETGNPVYPFQVTVGGSVLFAGSTFQANVPALAPQDVDYLANLLTFQPAFAPITLGTPALLLAAVGLLGMLRGARGPSRAASVALTTAIAADLLLFFSEPMRILREHWGDGSQRFLLVPFGLLLVGMAVLARAGERWQRFVLVIGVGALALEIAAANLATLARDAAVARVVLVLGTGAALAAACRPPLRWLALSIGIGWFVGLPLLANYRSATRHDSYARGFDLHLTTRDEHIAWIVQTLFGKDSGAGAISRAWPEVDDVARPARIAFVAGWANWGHNWMVYPLLGRRLQNQVVHVPATRSGGLGTYQADVAGEPLATPAEWIERVRASGAQILFVAMPAPPELAWAEAHPEVFELRRSGDAFRIFDVR